VIPYPPFFTGKAIHAALEFFYRDRKNFRSTLDQYFKEEELNLAKLGKLWPDEVKKVQEQVDLIEGMIDHYILWQENDTSKYCDDNLEFIDMEIDVVAELPNAGGLRYEGRLDGMIKHKPTGKYFIWEAKTARSIQQLLDSLPTDEQSTMYLWAARQTFDYPIEGVLYNVMRKKVPTYPNMTQSGLSKAKNVDCTSYFYRACVQDMYPDWDDETIDEMYGDIIETLRQKDPTFFVRFPVYRTPYEISMVLSSVSATARDMLNPDLEIYPAPGWGTCTFCRFKSPCVTMHMGGNYKALLDAEFQKRESHKSMRSEDSDDEE